MSLALLVGQSICVSGLQHIGTYESCLPQNSRQSHPSAEPRRLPLHAGRLGARLLGQIQYLPRVPRSTCRGSSRLSVSEAQQREELRVGELQVLTLLLHRYKYHS